MNNNSILVLSSDTDFIAAIREFLHDTTIVNELSANSGFHYCAILDFTTVKIDKALVYELKRKAHFTIFLVNDFADLPEKLVALASDVWQKPVPNQLLQKRLELLRYTYHNFLGVHSLVFDMKTPLVSIQGYADVLLSGMTGQLSEQQQNFLEYVRHLARRIQRRIHDFGDWEKIGHNELQLDLEILATDVLRNKLIQLQEEYEKAYSKPINVQIEESLPEVMVDIWRLVRVIDTLFNKIFRAIYSSLVFSLYQREDDLVFSFSVYPINIDYTNIEAFFTGDWEEYVLTKYIIEAHGGRIWLESEEGKGTSVYFTLPVAKDSSQ